MSQILNGSIDLSKIDKLQIKTVTKKDGSVGKYLDISIFINDEEDQYKNIASISIGQTKEAREAKEPKVYLGNMKRTWSSNGEGKSTVTANEGFKNIESDDLPF